MDKFFVNPGSATGAFTAGWGKDGEEPVPSFCLMDVRICEGPMAVVPQASDSRILTNWEGSRNLIDPIRLPITQGRQRERERGSGEGDLHEARGALCYIMNRRTMNDEQLQGTLMFTKGGGPALDGCCYESRPYERRRMMISIVISVSASQP